MRKRALAGVLGLALLTQAGCYAATLHTNAPREEHEHTGYGVIWLWGMVSTGETADCPAGVAYVHTEMPWWGLLVAGITGGIINPWSISWACTLLGGAPPAR